MFPRHLGRGLYTTRDVIPWFSFWLALTIRETGCTKRHAFRTGRGRKPQIDCLTNPGQRQDAAPRQAAGSRRKVEKMPEIQIKMNTEAAEPGTAAVLRDGKPIYIVDGSEVEVDYTALRNGLARANSESQQRRQALETICRNLGLTVDVRNDDGLAAVVAATENYKELGNELKQLKDLKEAGELDDSAADKIQAAAEKLRQEEIDGLQRSIEEGKVSLTKSEARADKVTKLLQASQKSAAFRAFYDKSKAFSDGTLETFLVVAENHSQDGYTWRPTGEVNAAGIPTLALQDDAGNVRKGADGVTPMTLNSWTETFLKQSHPRLFAQPQGSPDGITPAGGGPANKNAADMTPAELDAAARAVYS